MEITEAAQWTLRIVLPIILFIIYFYFQSNPADEKGYPGPSHNAHTRGKMLARRKLVDADEKPAFLSNLCLKSQADAPELFASSGRPGRGGGKGEGRERRERGERGGERGEKKPREKKADKKEEEDDDNKENEVPPADKADAPAAQTASASEEKMHTESLLNYVAFNKRAQHRAFLLEEGSSPPPPPRRTRPGRIENDVEVSGPAAHQANAEAQMVLRGAIRFRTAIVAKDLYEQLVDKQVEITERTFTLMIEGCVLAGDLKSASDFLMKMETAGYCPESELLDKVMDLYSQQKVQRERQAQEEPAPAPAPAAPPAPAAQPTVGSDEPPAAHGEEAAEGAAEEPTALAAAAPDGEERAKAALKLSSDAPIFVPTNAGLNASAPVFVPPAAPIVTADPDAGADAVRTSLRTRLVASAKPFEPQFNVTFDPAQHTWTVDKPEEEGDNGDGNGKGEKGKGEAGKGSNGKSKGGKEGKSGGKAKKGAEAEGKSGGKAKKGAAEKDGIEKPEN